MKVLCFGSINADHTYHLEHFLRPGETVSVNDYQIHAGGKGLNQAISLAKAGAEVYLAGCVGSGSEFLLQCAENAGVKTGLVRQVGEPSGHAIIQVDSSGQNCILVYPGANRAVTQEQVEDTLSEFSAGDILLVQNEINQVPYIVRRARERGLEVWVNPSPISEELEEVLLLVDWVILNETEGEALTGSKVPEKITAALNDKYPLCKVVLTLGEGGSVYASDGMSCHQAAYPTTAVDTTGAGDTFTGYFIETFARTQQPQEALRRASKASSIAVSRHGAAEAIPRAEEVDR